MTDFNHKQINDIIHGRVRLSIMSVLASQDKAVDFTYLKNAINASDGNLSTHMRKLEEAKYINLHKQFKNKRPQTLCELTPKGREEFLNYLAHLESLLPPK